MPENEEFTVDGIRLDPGNHEFIMALQFVLNTNRIVYLTGKAGSGKTTFLKYLKSVSPKNMAVLAPTGVAAINAGGQTIHSFFRIPPSLYTPDDKRLRTRVPAADIDKSTIYDNFKYDSEKRKVIKSLELLVIDEVSMVRADLLDVVDTLLRVYRKNPSPFGGVQVLLIGDTFQLPPVVKREDRDILFQFYDSEFFFSAKVMQRVQPIYIELKKIYRQSDQNFIDLLNRVRVNQTLEEDFSTFRSHLNPAFRPSEEDHYIILAPTRNKVDGVNQSKLDELPSRLVTYMAEVVGEFPENIRPAETDLKLKVGAQVMFIRNDSQKRFYNGKIGTVKELSDNEIKVEIEDNGQSRILSIEREIWDNVVYHWNEEQQCIDEEVVGRFRQFPLRLAWAITVHKSQGLTFEKVVADLGSSFASGQVYVALSRCTSMDGLVLTSEITPWSIKTDSRVLAFAENETPGTLLSQELNTSRADFYYKEARKAFAARNTEETVDNFFKALQYRNDVFADTFRRYIAIYLEKLFRRDADAQKVEKKQKDLLKNISSLQNENESLREKIRSLEEEAKSLSRKAEKKENLFQEKKRALKKRDKELSRAREEIQRLQEKLSLGASSVNGDNTKKDIVSDKGKDSNGGDSSDRKLNGGSKKQNRKWFKNVLGKK